VSRGGAILASLLATIGRPDWWLLALAGFLLRGGFVLFIVPIVLLPSPLAVSNIVAPVIIPIALGRIGTDAIAISVGAAALLSGWILIGGWIAAATELALIRSTRAAAVDEGVGSAPDAVAQRDRVLVGRLLAARLIAWLPLAVAIAVASLRIIAILYAELTRPVDVATPLAVRAALEAAPELAVVAIAWLVGEIVGSLAGRRIVLDGTPSGGSLRAGAGDLVRRPVSTLLPWLVTTGLLLTVLAGTVGAAGIAWSRVIVALSDRVPDPATIVLNLLLFVAIWLAAIVLAGLFAAVRASVQTFEEVRQRSATRTFGASAEQRPGDWSIPDEGGSL
jgi:hypothetical protein